MKPEITKHEVLFDLEAETGMPFRFAWIGLFTVADREGRFPWRPRALKAEILPFDAHDFSAMLDHLLSAGMVVKYRVGEHWYGVIPSWHEHQSINNRERLSELPDPAISDVMEGPGIVAYREARVNDASGTRGEDSPEPLGSAQAEGEGEGEGDVEGSVQSRSPQVVGGAGGQERVAAPSAQPPRGKRLDPEWKPKKSHVDRLMARFGITREQVKQEYLDFQNHFLSATGRTATKLDWSRAFSVWVGRTYKHRTKASGLAEKNAESLCRVLDDDDDEDES